MDFDGDGILDIITGSWPGQLYFFRGEGKGQFAPAVTLKDKDGKEIKLGSASTVFAVDWRGTGKLDLLVGCIEGHVWLVPNEGTREKPAYGKAQKMEADGKPISALHGDSHPIAADWMKEGKLGLLVGTGAGGVHWYRNVGDKGAPKLAAAVTLVPDVVRDDWQSPPKPGQWGMRAKICVVDWNGDGWPDLLMGDFNSWSGPQPKLTDEQQAKKKDLEAKLNKLFDEPDFKKIQEKFTAIFRDQKPDDSDEVKAKREEALKAYEKEMAPFTERMTAIHKELTPLGPPHHMSGNVWLFERRLPAARKE